MNAIYTAVSNRMELPVSLLEADETVSQLVSILTKVGHSDKTIANILTMYLSALRQNIRRDK
jgi:hypothetical protein